MSVERIKSAVLQCLDHCYASQNWYRGWSQFMEKLFHDRTWTIAEVEAVQLVMCKLLLGSGVNQERLLGNKPSGADVEQALKQLSSQQSRQD
ncbi:hypothetical protein ETAA8_67060 [Anatilimnocola aggregata]|uniref:Uncharacterized protein n=1 Tax=Anatilimnocola aggregata TaxID=2528021 RepID=A0A517YMV2_9BACT|nr:hypothetical protein [Anatilimnocola aggregata]QDU31547.1 hypothetical protein ETAA8_67060 [Anatilimnocola aggregata]